MEWILDKDCKAFNVQAVVLGSIKAMKKVDHKLVIMNSVTGKCWEEINKISKG